MSEPDSHNDDSSLGPAAPANGDGVPICPHCMAAIEPYADFCRQCGAPLSVLAAMDPYKRVFAQGWIYRKATSHPTSLIVLVGMWLIFAPGVYASWRMLPWHQPFAMQGAPIMAVLSFGFFFGGVALYAAILFRVTAQYLRQRSYRRGYCPQCGHSLTGFSEPRCPECGSPFDPKEVLDTEDPDEDAAASEEPPPQ